MSAKTIDRTIGYGNVYYTGAELRAQLAADGYVIVPRTATEAMVKAVDHQLGEPDPRVTWDIMVKAWEQNP